MAAQPLRSLLLLAPWCLLLLASVPADASDWASAADGAGRKLGLRQIKQSGGAPDDCPENPTKEECKSYTYPKERAEQDLDMLCSSMPAMSGCSVRNACKNGDLTSEKVCHHMQLLASICDMMPNMGGCSTYTTMCGDDTVIEQCLNYNGIRRLPGMNDLESLMTEMCTDHPMEQCEECKPAQNDCPDPLAALSGACADMPNMPQCSTIHRLCRAHNDGSMDFYCGDKGGGSSSGLPSMLMYFHKRISETVLWTEWVPRSVGDYAGTIIAVFFFGICSIGIKTGTTLLGMYWKTQAAKPNMHKYLMVTECSLPWFIPSFTQWWQNAIKAVLLGISILLDYWNMLIAMTFNVGLFCAVILGYMLGIFFFSSLPDNYHGHLQMLMPPRTHVDCECPATFEMAAKQGTENGHQGGKEHKDNGQRYSNVSQESDFMTPACCVSAH